MLDYISGPRNLSEGDRINKRAQLLSSAEILSAWEEYRSAEKQTLQQTEEAGKNLKEVIRGAKDEQHSRGREPRGCLWPLRSSFGKKGRDAAG